MQKIVLASNNAKKLKELSALLTPLGIQLIPQGELGVPEAEEPHHTFLENALAKARHAAQLTGLPALADDSGLCVKALGGAPGVQSARYAGEPKSDARNNEKLLAALTGVADRRAHFVSLLVLVRHGDDPPAPGSRGRVARRDHRPVPGRGRLRLRPPVLRAGGEGDGGRTLRRGEEPSLPSWPGHGPAAGTPQAGTVSPAGAGKPSGAAAVQGRVFRSCCSAAA